MVTIALNGNNTTESFGFNESCTGEICAAKCRAENGQIILTVTIYISPNQNGSCFNLWDHDGCIRVRRYADEHCLPDCIIERHSGLTRVMVWGAISYHGRSRLLRMEGISGAIFQQHNAYPLVAKTVRVFCSAKPMQLLPWSAYSPLMSHIEHMWDLVGRRLTSDPRPAASKYELLLRIQAI
ncbi:transposable element Tcb2 transposase [Trichonephila clavipes]|nr:transposable element Tcb2 transposase [Trichonephila clavipes]